MGLSYVENIVTHVCHAMSNTDAYHKRILESLILVVEVRCNCLPKRSKGDGLLGEAKVGRL